MLLCANHVGRGMLKVNAGSSFFLELFLLLPRERDLFYHFVNMLVVVSSGSGGYSDCTALLNVKKGY